MNYDEAIQVVKELQELFTHENMLCQRLLALECIEEKDQECMDMLLEARMKFYKTHHERMERVAKLMYDGIYCSR